VSELGQGIHLCEMYDAPTPLGPLLVTFAILALVGVFAGRSARASTIVVQVFGQVALYIVAWVSFVLSSWQLRWGILADRATCTPLENGVTWAIIVALNAGVLMSSLAWRPRVRK